MFDKIKKCAILPSRPATKGRTKQGKKKMKAKYLIQMSTNNPQLGVNGFATLDGAMTRAVCIHKAGRVAIFLEISESVAVIRKA